MPDFRLLSKTAFEESIMNVMFHYRLLKRYS